MRREPLIHFLLGALVLVAVHAWLTGPDDRTIRVPVAAKERAIAGRQVELGRPLTEDERSEVLNNLVDDEILWREARARGLDEIDQVRTLLTRRMGSILVPEPPPATPNELRAWYDAHPGRFDEPAHVDFDQVWFAPGTTVPEGLAAELGGEFWTLGDPLGPASSVRRASAEELRRDYGVPFADAVAAAPLARWTGPVSSTLGTHFVRVLDRRAAIPASFEEAESRVRADWRAGRMDAALRRKLDELREDYRVEIEGEP